MSEPDCDHLPAQAGAPPASGQDPEVAQQDCQTHSAQPAEGQLWLP